MKKHPERTRRAVALSLSALLCASMIPFAGCAPANQATPDQGAENKPISASQDPMGSANARTVGYDPSGYQKPEEKWASFDDGSLALDVVQTHVNANSAQQNITVKLENGAVFASSVATGDVTLTGGLCAWNPVAVERVSDTEINITAQRDESATVSPGTSIAGVSLGAGCVVPPQVDTTEQDAYFDRMIAEGGDEELAEGIEADSGAQAAKPAAQPVAKSGVAGGMIPLAYADETDASDDSTYEAAVPFVHPSMLVDVADTVAADGKTTYRIVASEFAFPEGIGAGDFSIELAETAPADAVAPKIESVKRLGDFEIEVVVADDATKRGSVCDFAALRLGAQASGTGGDVACPLILPDAWVNAEVTEFNDKPVAESAGEGNGEAGEGSSSSSAESSSASASGQTGAEEPVDVKTVTVNTKMHNSDDNAAAPKVGVLRADGTYHEVTDAVFEKREDGSTDITLDASTLKDLAKDDPATPGSSSSSSASAGGDSSSSAAASSDSSSGSSAPVAGGDGDSDFTLDEAEGDFLVVSAGEFNASEAAKAPEKFEMLPFVSLILPPMTAVAEGNAAMDSSYSSNFAFEDDDPVSDSFDFVALAKDGATSLLGGIASSAWTYVRSTWLIDTPLGEHTINQLYDKIIETQTQLSNLASSLDVLSNKEASHYNANIVNAANAKIARVQSQYALIGGLYAQVIAAGGDEAAAQAAVANLMSSKKIVVDNLLVDMGELFNIIKVADASTGSSLVEVFDNMAALSYNWGPAAAPARQSYRDSLAEVWVGCTTMLYVICGSDAYKDEYAISLTNLQNMTKEVNKLFEKHPVNANEYERAAGAWSFKNGNPFVKAEGKAYFCYTTNEWYAMCPGTTSHNAWNKAFFTIKKHGKVYDYSSASPYISWDNSGKAPSWGNYYLTTAQAQSMVGRLGNNRSLLGELSSFYDLGSVKYLVCDPKFSMKSGDSFHNESNWYFDTYEFNEAKTATTFTEKRIHFLGDVYKPVFKKAKKTTNASSPMITMLAIARVDVK